MQGKTTVIAAATLAVAIAALVGWQSWNNHRLQRELSALQQQLASQQLPLPAAAPAGTSDPFADMQRMQAEMHQRMQQLMEGFGMPGFGSSLFDEAFGSAPGFGSSMGFGADPEFSLQETADSYEVSISIPEGSNVEITTEVNGRDLTIAGKVTLQQSPQGNGGFRSLQTRQFARTLTLPADVDPLGISNATRSGQVVITLPKQSSALSSQPTISVPQV